MRGRKTVAVIAVVLFVLFGAINAAAVATPISEHSTESDFRGGDVTTQNMTVNGSGASATVDSRPVQEGSTFTASPSSTYFGTDARGFVIQVKENVSALNISVTSGTTATRLRLMDNSTGAVLETYSSSPGEVISIEHEFDDAVDYRLAFDSNGNDYEIERDGSVSYPVTRADFDIIGGYGFNDFAGADEVTAVVGGDSSTYEATHSGTNATQGVIDVAELSDASVTATYQAADGSGGWTDLTTQSITSTGETTVSLPEVQTSEYRVFINATNTGTEGGDWAFSIDSEEIIGERNQPQISQVKPPDEERLSDSTVDLTANISDEDFGEVWGDTVTVRWFGNGEELHNETISSDQQVSYSWSEFDLGENEWRIEVEDEYGFSATTGTQTFYTPGELRIYNESDTDQLINDSVEVEVNFFGEDNSIITRTTTDGTINLQGLPVDTEFTIQLESDSYVTRQTIIRDIFQQQDVFMLPDSTESVSTQFEVTDPTGQIRQDNSRIIIKKPVERNGSTEWMTIVGDEMGPGGFSTLLERDQRYKIEIEDLSTGDVREMGPYIATEPRTVTLDVNEIEYEFGDADAGYQWNAEWLNETAPAIDFAFGADNSISELHVTITERGGNNTVLLDETWTDEDSVQKRVVIPDSVANVNTSTFNVEWEATIVTPGGETTTITGSTVVGPRGEIDIDGVPQSVLSVVGVFLILMVGGLFSYANIGVGGVVTSLFAGLLWFVGIVPGSVSGLAIGFALLISVLWMVRQARGPV